MSRETGANIDDIAHLEQSITDIVTTPLGTRTAARDYGCEFPYIVDKPIDRQWVIDSFLFIAVAIARWEPRYLLSRVRLDASNVSAGIILLGTDGLYKPLGKIIVLENVVLNFGATPNA